MTFILQPSKLQGKLEIAKTGTLARFARIWKTGKAGTGVLVQDTFTPIFVMLHLYLGTLHLDTVSNGGDPPCALPSPNPPQKENLLASLGG